MSNSTDGGTALGRFVGYPPGSVTVQVPAGSRRAALAGMALYTPCRRLTVAAHLVAWTAASVVGPRALPGRRRDPFLAIGPPLWEALCAAWRGGVGAFDNAAVYQRRQQSRQGIAALLLAEDRPIAFVKARPAPSTLAVESDALARVHLQGEKPFTAPRALAQGCALGWDWLALSPLPPRPHRPARRPPVAAIVAAVQTSLHARHRPSGAPAHWRPMHGDLAPWNLRRLAGGRLVLIDWEDSSWGPPAADEVYYEASVAALTGRRPAAGDDEAARFWVDRLRGRSSGDFDEAFDRKVCAALTEMAGRSGDGLKKV